MMDGNIILDAGTMVLPRKLFKNDFAFGIDFGSSIIKLAYTTKEDDNLRIQFVNVSRYNVEEAMDFIKKECAGKLSPGSTTYCISGVGVAEQLRALEDTLNIKCSIESEHVMSVDAFIFRDKHQSWEDFVYPPNAELREVAKATAKILASPLMDGILPPERGIGFPLNLPPDNQLIDNTVHYPVLFCIVGSGHYVFKVDANGMLQILDNYIIAGKTFLGLGSLLATKTKNFNEILTLASQGNANALDQTISNLGASDDDETYSGLNHGDSKVFSFGLAAGEKSKDFKTEDTAAALVSMIGCSVAQSAFNWSVLMDIQQVFMVGGIPSNSELFRNEIEREYFVRCYANPKKHTSDCLFVKGGGHLSALGCLLRNLEVV